MPSLKRKPWGLDEPKPPSQRVRGVQWTPLPKAKAPTEPIGETGGTPLGVTEGGSRRRRRFCFPPCTLFVFESRADFQGLFFFLACILRRVQV